MLTGNSPSVGVRKIDFNEVLTVTSNKVTLSKTPVGTITNVFVYELDGTNGTEFTLGTPATNPSEYSITGKQITFHTTVSNNTRVRVYYIVETDNKATTVKVTSDKFGASFRVVLDCQVVDEHTKQIFKAQIRIPTAKFEDKQNCPYIQ